jgi:hypothetical protein
VTPQDEARVRGAVEAHNPLIPSLEKNTADAVIELMAEQDAEIARLNLVVREHNTLIDQLRLAVGEEREAKEK